MDKRFKKMNNVVEHYEDDEIPADWEFPNLPTAKKLDDEIVVTLKHVQKVYELSGREESVTALEDIHVYPGSEFYPVRRGEFVMLRGPSGGGKTTLLNILGTIDKATAGTVEILGQPVDVHSTDAYLSQLRLEKIGFVFQTFNLLATMSAFENVELPMIILGKMSEKEIKQRAAHLLKLVGLQDRMNHLPSELSGGEQQRVTIARALANEPELLLLDEPTGDLDTKNTIEVMDLLLDINNKHKTTCVMVSHNPDVECYADRILYIADGKFVKQAVNIRQTKLIYDQYIKFVNEQHTTSVEKDVEEEQEIEDQIEKLHL
jgi:putative ABC transport system ATP-binding protein